MFTPRKIFLTLQKSAVVIEIEINFKLLYSILSFLFHVSMFRSVFVESRQAKQS